MSLLKAFQGLSSRARLGVGAGLLTWATIGFYLSDRAEAKYGFTPSETEKDALEKMKPKIHLVHRQDRS